MAEERKKKFNIKQYNGLVDSVSTIKDVVEKERLQALGKEQALQDRIKKGESESQAIQKELSVQLRCAGRSYQQLLGATRDLTEQLRDEEQRRQFETTTLEDQVKDLKQKLANAAKPWKEEVFKRDVKILKLQEAATDQEVRVREALAEMEKERGAAKAEIIAHQEKAESMLREMDVVREEKQAAELASREELEEAGRRAAREAAELKMELREVKATVDGIAAPYIKQVKELEMKVEGLERQLDAVDYAPYEKKVKQKEVGYERLIKDFGVKQKMNDQRIDKMRIGFEDVIKKMDKQIQDNEKTYEIKLAPWKEQVAKKEAKIEKLQKTLDEMRAEEEKTRAHEAAEKEELLNELNAAKGAVDVLNGENYKLRRELDRVKEELEGGGQASKIKVLEFQLEEVTRKCEAMLKSKDRDLKEKSDMVTRLQQRLVDMAEATNKADKEWDLKVQAKEEGYQLVIAQLAYSEGQIREERNRTQEALKTVKRREETITRLEAEHAEELRVRKLDHDELLARVRDLEAELDEAAATQARTRAEFEEMHETFRRRDEVRVEDLRLEMARLERAKAAVQTELAKLRMQFEKARASWQDKQRELEGAIRSRDRQITGLQNEIEFINDSWEIKYNRLMGIFDKLQKKYDELIGPGGVAEAFRRARDLKQDNQMLTAEIAELKEMIKKQKRQIRDYQLDIDMHMKETALLIQRKEQGMAKMVGENAKLEGQLREERELKERLVKELTEEKKNMVSSFQDRINQLEQLVESMRYTDRQELIDRIAVWKRAYGRISVERDELEDDYRQLLDAKDLQLKNMAVEHAEVVRQVEEEKAKGLAALEEADAKWQKKLTQLQMEKMQVEKELLKQRLELDKASRETQKAVLMADHRQEDPEKDGLRKQIKEQEEQIAALEAGIKRFIQDNTALLEENNKIKEQLNAAQEDFAPQIKWRDERYEAMVKEHDALKEVLQTEMKKAQDTCKAIEEQVRKFPNPFEAELKELKDRYAQTQAGMLKMSRDNLTLKEELLDYKEEAAKERDELEEGLKMASHILREVASLGALKSMNSDDLSSLEKFFGVDLDGDGVVGREQSRPLRR